MKTLIEKLIFLSKLDVPGAQLMEDAAAELMRLTSENNRLHSHIATDPRDRIGATIEIVDGVEKAVFIDEWKRRAESYKSQLDQLHLKD